jgi:superoxide dismutase, Fe-Mn family
MGMERVLEEIDQLDATLRTPVRNNGGGHANHSLFWEIMSPGGGGEPDGALAKAIADTFDTLDELKGQLNDAAMKRFGSGWSWLVHDGVGLSVVSTANQDSPLMTDQRPLLGIDVWEHAYYLRYQNRRQEYLDAWWNLVDWQAVGKRYAAATA